MASTCRHFNCALPCGSSDCRHCLAPEARISTSQGPAKLPRRWRTPIVKVSQNNEADEEVAGQLESYEAAVSAHHADRPRWPSVL